VAYLELLHQQFPAQHFAYFRGDVWALAMWGTTRQCMTNITRTWVFVDRHLASWKRLLAELQWDLKGSARHWWATWYINWVRACPAGTLCWQRWIPR